MANGLFWLYFLSGYLSRWIGKIACGSQRVRQDLCVCVHVTVYVYDCVFYNYIS